MVRFARQSLVLVALCPGLALPAAGQSENTVTVPPAEAAAPADMSGASAAALPPFAQSLGDIVEPFPEIAEFYRERDFEAIWTDADDAARRRALARALKEAGRHGLPQERFAPARMRGLLAGVTSAAERGEAEAALTRLFLRYARAVSSGVLEPSEVDPGIKRQAPRPETGALLRRIAEEAPAEVFGALPPASDEYARLLDAKLRLEKAIAAGGWGAPVGEARVELGDTGPAVGELRDRLRRMGYPSDAAPAFADEEAAQGDLAADAAEPTAAAGRAQPQFDAELDEAVRAFQRDHGVIVDGIVGPGTRAALNAPPERRLGQVLAALERERWMNFDRGDRHVWVNLPDFTARLIDDGEVTFETRTVIGASQSDRRSPEFSDEIEHMVINPTWHVPRSIAIKEYLPQFKADPYSNRHLEIHYKGEAIARERINWPVVTKQNWPFALKQPPGGANALGRVKFMFPNRWNIYLHDTPAKSLFDQTSRGFSHGCIRLSEPFEFAYLLLAPQTDDPQGLFRARLDSGREITVPLEQHVPVHLVYRTAFFTPEGELVFRPDIYGRDARILEALVEAGVALPGAES